MKKIIVITTGGTIGSVLQDSSITVDITGRNISHEIDRAKLGSDYQIEVISPINMNSESFSPDDWCKILHALMTANNRDVAGIVVTHGTDTMEYSIAAALAYGSYWKMPICFTGSYYSPDHPSSDARLNLMAALEFVASPNSPIGVYIAFRSGRLNQRARIIHGASLLPMIFDDEYFTSTYNKAAGSYSMDAGLVIKKNYSPPKFPVLGKLRLPSSSELKAAQSQIALISLYPGIDEQLLNQISFQRKVVVIQMYHSGTGPFGKHYSDLINFIKSNSPQCAILMGTFPKKFIDIPYDSTLAIKSAGGHIYGDLQAYYLYVFALLGLTLGLLPEEITQKLSDWEI